MVSSALGIQDGAPGEKQDPAAGGSKPKVKVKSIDLPIITKNIRQLDGSVLNDFVEYEVRATLGLCTVFLYFRPESWLDKTAYQLNTSRASGSGTLDVLKLLCLFNAR